MSMEIEDAEEQLFVDQLKNDCKFSVLTKKIFEEKLLFFVW